MSIVNWEREGKFKCPHCKKHIHISEQDSEGYGQNVFIHKGRSKSDFIDIKWE